MGYTFSARVLATITFVVYDRISLFFPTIVCFYFIFFFFSFISFVLFCFVLFCFVFLNILCWYPCSRGGGEKEEEGKIDICHLFCITLLHSCSLSIKRKTKGSFRDKLTCLLLRCSAVHLIFFAPRLTYSIQILFLLYTSILLLLLSFLLFLFLVVRLKSFQLRLRNVTNNLRDLETNAITL
jgi:hypothetical protein